MAFDFLKAAGRPPRQITRERMHAVGGREMPLRIVENARAKRLTLRINPGGRGLRITVPPGVSEREIDGFIERHHGWLEKQLLKMPDKPDIRAGVKIPIRGVPHRIVHEPGKRGTTIARIGEDGPELAVFGDTAFIHRRVADYLKRLAKAEIEPLVAKHTGTVGRRARSISYRDTTSRWGSCSHDGKLSFCWRIMMAPHPVIDYLVAHEVAHLREMNHGPKFWALCNELCPRTQEAKAWLKRNGSALQAIGLGNC
jgi:predicted metal-dependent hydrolase